MSDKKELKKAVKEIGKLTTTLEEMVVSLGVLLETASKLGMVPAGKSDAGSSSDSDSDAGKASSSDSDSDSDIDISKMKKPELVALIKEKKLDVKHKKIKKIGDLRKAVADALAPAGSSSDSDSDAGKASDSDSDSDAGKASSSDSDSDAGKASSSDSDSDAGKTSDSDSDSD